MNCAKCNTELKPVFPDLPDNSRQRNILNGFDEFGDQYSGAVVITLSGGYGMGFDNIEIGNPKVVVCKACGYEVVRLLGLNDLEELMDHCV